MNSPHNPPDPLAAPRLTAKQSAAANGRRLLLIEARPLFAAGLSCAQVSKSLRVPNARLYRLLQSAPAGNAVQKIDFLLAQSTSALAPRARRGRCSEFAALLQTPEIRDEMIRLYAATVGASSAVAAQDRRTGSIATTLKRLADFHLVPESLAARLRSGFRPAPLVGFLKKNWTPEMEMKFRGQRHYTLNTIVGRRDLVEELADGTLATLKPGRVWGLDDMSSNVPFWFDFPRLKKIPNCGLAPMIARHGCAIGRQGLYAWDWASSAWLGFDLIGRLHDAYTAADILRLLRKLIKNYGKPEAIVLEGGIFNSKTISGWTVSDSALVETANGIERPEMSEIESARLRDGIRAIGVKIIRATSARAKPIEGAFNHLQRLLPTFFERGEAVNIGRFPGEFDWAARQTRRAANGVRHARELGFVKDDRLADVTWQAMTWEGCHEKNRFGWTTPQKPLEVLTNFLSASPLPAAEESDLAVCLPVKIEGRKIVGGKITVTVLGREFDFVNPKIFAALGDGASVDVAFDDCEPQAGMAVYDSRGFLCWANYLPAGPVLSARDRRHDPAVETLRAYKKFHSTRGRMLDLKSLRTVRFDEMRAPGVAADNDSPRGEMQLIERSLNARQHAVDVRRARDRHEAISALADLPD